MDIKENEKYNLLKNLAENNIFNKFIDIPFIKQTNEVINIIKNNIDSYNFNYNNLYKIIEENKQNFLLERIECIYLLNKRTAKIKSDNLINKVIEIKGKINELQLINKYLNTYLKNNCQNEINEINNIINSLSNESLNNLDKIDIKKYNKYYIKEKDIFYKYNSKLFKIIYDKNISIIKEEEKLLKESLNDYKTLSKLFHNNNDIFNIDENILQICFGNNSDSNDININNEIDILNKVFNNSNKINHQEIINDIKIVLKRNYFFKAISAIINFIDNLKIKKTEYTHNLNNILLNKEKIDINILRKCFDDIKYLNNDIINDEKFEYIDILIELIGHGDIIQFLLEISGSNIIDNLNEENKNKIKDIKICCDLFKELNIKNNKDKELIEIFKNKVSEKKGIIDNFKNIINNSNLYDSLFKYRPNIFKNLILSKELVYKLLEKHKDFNDVFNSLYYLKKDTILFFNVINEKKDLILKAINENKNNTNEYNYLSLDFLNGIEISSLNKNIFNDLENIYIHKKEEFYEKIVSSAKNIDDIKTLFLCNSNKNETYEKILENKYKEIIEEYIKDKNNEELIKSIYFSDKNKFNLNYLINEIKNKLDFDTKNKIYINLIDKYNDLSNYIKNIIANHLTKEKNWDKDFLIEILKKYHNIKNELLSNIDNKISIKEKNFQKINNNEENIDYNLLKNIISQKIISKFDEIPKINSIFKTLKTKINKNNFIYNDLTEIFQNEKNISLLKERMECIYFLDNNDMNKNYEKLKEKYDEIKKVIEEFELILKYNEYFEETCNKNKIDEIIRLLKEKDLNYFENKIKNNQYKEYKKYIDYIKNSNIINKNNSETFKRIYNDKKNKIKEEEQCLNETLVIYDNYLKLFNQKDINNIDINLLNIFMECDDKNSELNIMKKIFNVNKEINNEELINDINSLINKNKIKKILMIIIPILILVLIIVITLLSKSNNIEQKEYKNEINWDIFNITKDQAKSEEINYGFIELPPQKEKKNPTNKEKLIIGIDLGTINTKISYIKDNNDISKIRFNEITLNEIEISRNTNKGLKHSTKASFSLKNYGKKELDKINFIKGIKTIFSLDKYNNDNLCYIYPNEYISNLNIKNLIKEYFIMLQNDILEATDSQRLNKDNIKWIIAVPSVLSEFTKQIIYNAAIESGMNNIKLVYENEAASLTMFNDHNIDKKFKEKNKIFMLIDAGGYYTNITINQILDKDLLKEKIKISNDINNRGIVAITEEIINVLEQIYGKYNIDKIKREKPGEWTETLHEINKIIEKVYDINGRGEYDIKSRFKLRGTYEYSYKTGNDIKKYTIRYNDFSVIFPEALLGNIIYNNVKNISDNVDKVINEISSKKIIINSIMITGGLSKHIIFKNEIQKKFKNIPVNYLTSYEKVVSNGAVIYGLDSTKIKSRISPATIGIRKKGENNDEIEILVKKGEQIENYLISKYIKPSSKEQEIIQLNIYLSENNLKNEKLSENDFFGRLLLHIKKNYDEIIQLNIIYDVVLSFYAVEYKSQKEIKSNFEFFK